MIVRNVTRGLVLGDAVRQADSFISRLKGLMFTPRLESGQGLLIRPCQAVHTHFMRFSIDVIFLDGAGRVVWVMTAMPPWRQSPFIRGAEAVLELPAHAAGTTGPGDQLELIG